MQADRMGRVAVMFAVMPTLFLFTAAQAAAQQAPKAPTKAAAGKLAPKFVVDPTWPHIPNGWTLGQVAGVTVDPATDHIWIIQRPRSIKPGVKTGPPVMEFDQAGNYIQGWGGPNEGYDWPTNEHGIYIDYKENVWVSGNDPNDQVLKFTRDGKFLIQIGKSRPKKSNADTDQFFRPADVFVYPKTNEVFVADGYGNRRIIVFDADTGAFKRMWGAYGKPPQDESTTPPPAGPRTLATDFDPNDPGDPQFRIIHSVKVSNDGFVYTADRGGKRVQIFTVGGTFLSQIWIDRWCESNAGDCGNGETAASVAFSPDPAQRFLYVGSINPERIWVYDRKTLQPLESFGRLGIAHGEFDVLHVIAVDAKGNLYTAEVQDGRRVQKFAYKGLVPAPASPQEAAR